MQVTLNSIRELVTSTPVQRLHAKSLRLSELGPAFMNIDFSLHLDMERDNHADKLRSLLLPFNWYMNFVTCKLADVMDNAIIFYGEPYIENREKTPVKEFREQSVRVSFDVILREARIYGQEIVAALEEAIPALKDHALSLLPEIEKELGAYVDGYKDRYYITERRSRSWVPFAIQDFIWGSVEPATKDISQIEILPDELSRGITHLQELPEFLEDLRHHFTHLTSLTREDYVSLGYLSAEGFTRLCTDRRRCCYFFLEMSDVVRSFSMPSGGGKDFKTKKDIDPDSPSHKNI
ncbi:hypothetical protein CPB86DRAFT_426979 [Serendipita vermifera]|nr:hypothetical protein CPB86DRAFT_426979 [Serendipita vermifera]